MLSPGPNQDALTPIRTPKSKRGAGGHRNASSSPLPPAQHLGEVRSCFSSSPSKQHLCKQDEDKRDKTAFMQELLHTERVTLQPPAGGPEQEQNKQI